MRVLKIIIMMALVSSCSVAMASKKRGVDIETIMGCQSRACFVALRDTQVVESNSWEEGEKVVFKSLKPQGSTGRAVMHGLLDVVTLGIWEVAGTPIEGNKNDEEYLVYTVYFNQNGVAQKVEVYGAS